VATLADLIIEATAAGYDVTIRMRQRDDGKEGTLDIPNHWARRLGMSDEEIERHRVERQKQS
jgi:hypothetical protein